MDSQPSFGRWLKQHRIMLGLTQEVLAEQVGCSVETIRKIEAEQRRPSGQIARRLAQTLAIPAEQQLLFLRLARDGAPEDVVRMQFALAPLREPSRSQRPAVLPPPARPRSNLPAALSSFVGRQRELALVKRRLTSTRLLTLTGVGGTGKTRLALQAASELGEHYADGIWLAELAPLSDPRLIAQAIAQAVGVREETGRGLQETLLAALRERHMLLLLDNCEHLVAGCAALAAQLLAGCPQLRILATSRERLSIVGEAIYAVPPLALPARDAPPSALLQSEAVQLLVARIAAVQPEFTLDETQAPLLAELSRRLDGLPLALELAAARVQHMPLRQMLARLDQRFQLLRGGSRTALPRQQTLYAAIDWSYNLLAAPEQQLLARLAVFSGGWTLEAAEAVCADAASPPGAVFELLVQLIDKSLVLAESQHGEARYHMLEMIREYALQRLEAGGEASQLRNAHLGYYLALVEHHQEQLQESDQAFWSERLELEHDNLRAALHWAFASAASEQGLRLAVALMRLWVYRGHLREGRKWLSLAETSTAVTPALRGRALAIAGALSWMLGDASEAGRMAEQAVVLLRGLNDTWGLAFALHFQSLILVSASEFAAARALAQESVTLSSTLGDPWLLAVALFALGEVELAHDPLRAQPLLERSFALLRERNELWFSMLPLTSLARLALRQGDYLAAEMLCEQGLTIRRQLNDPVSLIVALNAMGDVARCQDNAAWAEQLYEEALVLARQQGGRAKFAWTLHNLAHAALAQGNGERAAALLRESLALEREIGSQIGMLRCLAGLAGIATVRGQPRPALRLFGVVATLLDALGAGLEPADQRASEHYLALARSQLHENDSAAQEEGVLDLDGAIQYALHVLELDTEKASLTMQITTGAVHHIALTVRDVASSSEFYRRLLGFQPIGAFGLKALLTNGSVVLALGPAPHQPLPNDRFDENRLGLDHLSLSVASRAELEAMLQLLDEQGVVHGAIVELPAAQIAVLAFRDPDNIQIELTAPLP